MKECIKVRLKELWRKENDKRTIWKEQKTKESIDKYKNETNLKSI